MKYIFCLFKSAFLIAAVIFTVSCPNNSAGSVEREDLFSLEIGPMEDQIGLYRLDGNRGIRRTGFTMREGLFFIADGNSGKIVRYNSYGDMLFMIYNEDTNPPPIALRTITEDEHATRWAYSYPLEEPGWISVDSRGHIFVEDRLPLHDQRFDQETRSLLDGIILHFDQNGRFINYLGREGIGGSPFPRIVGMTTSVNDELAIICRLPDGWNIYWFSSSGILLYIVKISSDIIPPLSDWPEAISIIDSITASPDSRRLYIKVDYNRDTFDQSTNTRTGSEPINSVIWTFNIENGSYVSSVEIPLFEIVENGRPTDIRVFYSVLGAARNGKILFYFPVETGYTLLYVDTQTKEQRRGFIQFSSDELRYNDFFLSTEGILCAMLADNFNVKLVWWRTDRFMGESL
ncbi:MAG: hypothetical protein FWD24_04960 [Treponema sp.]|nr:hypothetical protein [Treponema sp.]